MIGREGKSSLRKVMLKVSGEVGKCPRQRERALCAKALRFQELTWCHVALTVNSALLSKPAGLSFLWPLPVSPASLPPLFLPSLMLLGHTDLVSVP